MSEFHDPDLRQQLGRLSGPYPDDNAAFAAWQRRVGQARRRRAMAWTTGAALSLIVATVAVAAVQNPTRHSVVPGKSSETSAEFTISVASTEPEETDPATTESTSPETSAATTLAPDTTSSSVEAETSLPEPEGDGAAGDQPAPTHSGTRTSVPPGGSQSATQTFSGVGGSITVRQDGGRLTVVAVNPKGGFHNDESNNSGQRVEVTFKSDKHETHITVKLSDGVMKPTVDETTDTHQDSPPDDTSGGGHGDGEN